MGYPRVLNKTRADGKPRCSEVVATSGLRMHYHQCGYVAVDEGKCKIHRKAAAAARAAKSRQKYEETQKWEARRNMLWHGAPLINALRAIATGHNDPRSLAASVLNENNIPLQEESK